MYGTPDFETTEDDGTDLAQNRVTATFRGGSVEVTAQDDARREQSVFMDGETLLDLADAYRDEHGDPRDDPADDRECAVCGDPLGDRTGDYCSTGCALRAAAGDE